MIKLKDIIKEFGQTPVDKTNLKNDVENTISTLRTINGKVNIPTYINRFASGSKSELYINVNHKNKNDRDEFVNNINSKFKIVGKTRSDREIYKDTNNNIHFRIVNVDDNETTIIFNRRKPTGR